MNWNKSSIDSTLVREIASQYHISLIEASVLVRRGITFGRDILYFLEKDFIYLHQPFLFKDMEIVVERIKSAQEEGEIVFVYGDKDVDGITSTAILVRTLRELGLEVLWRVPTGNFGYGLSKEDIDFAYEHHATLIITIDCGISSCEEVSYARTQSMDVLIFDHHTPGIQVPEAVAIINPKVQAQQYPFQGLCAAVVAQKIRLALAISHTDIYNTDVILLNIIPLNKAYKIEIVCVRNLVIQWSKIISIGEYDAEFQKDTVIDILKGYDQIVVFNSTMQKHLFSKIMSNVDFECLDIQPQVEKYFPRFKEKSLLTILHDSRLVRYLEKEPEEIDILFQLYCSVVYAHYPQLKQSFYEVSDLATIATIADMMPLLNENRIIYKMGIKKLQSNPQENLQLFLDVLQINKEYIDSRTIGWNIAPVINSSGRMGKADVAVSMLLADNPDEVIHAATQLLQCNKDRKNTMNELKFKIKMEAEQSLEENTHFILLYNESLPHSFTGMVAGQYARQYEVPVVILAKRDDDIITGSIRSPSYFHVPSLIQELHSYLIDGGGHSAAGGFSLQKKQKEVVLRELHAYLVEHTSGEHLTHSAYSIDVEIPEKIFVLEEVRNMQAMFEPYGQEWASIQYLLTNVPVKQCELVGKGKEHIKFLVKLGNTLIPAFLWQYSTHEPAISEEEIASISTINMIVSTKIEVFRNELQFSLVIQDFECV